MSLTEQSRSFKILTPIQPNAAATVSDSGVRFESRGVVLVTGPAEIAIPAGQALTKHLRVLVCVTGSGSEADIPKTLKIMVARITVVSGYLGAFSAKALAGNETQIDLGPFSFNSDGLFDLVLDLNTTALLSEEVRPLGYYAPTRESEAINAAIGELSQLVGAFRKPRYFRYDADLCAHDTQGIAGCSRCLSSCPAKAIMSSDDRISVDPHLCQGCATCVIACPTGALTYTTAQPEEVYARLMSWFDNRTQRTTLQPTLLIHEQDDAIRADELAAWASATPFAVSAIASIGADFWLAALARGASRVIVVPPLNLPESTRSALTTELRLLQDILQACGEPISRIVFLENRAVLPADEANPHPTSLATPFVGQENKRERFEHALERFLSASIQSITPVLDLPPGAPFGAVELAAEACTMCGACSNLCPTGALFSDENGLMRLRFIESHCVQCGICERGCPESAISLVPRLLLKPETWKAARTLNEDRPHECPECGTPFISRALLMKSAQIMRAQAVIPEEAILGLQRCPRCRAQAMLR